VGERDLAVDNEVEISLMEVKKFANVASSGKV
jgi:hypothetical protein